MCEVVKAGQQCNFGCSPTWRRCHVSDCSLAEDNIFCPNGYHISREDFDELLKEDVAVWHMNNRRRRDGPRTPDDRDEPNKKVRTVTNTSIDKETENKYYSYFDLQPGQPLTKDELEKLFQGTVMQTLNREERTELIEAYHHIRCKIQIQEEYESL